MSAPAGPAPFATLARTQSQVLGANDPLILVYRQDAPALNALLGKLRALGKSPA